MGAGLLASGSLALVRLLAPVPAVESAAAGRPRDRAAARARHALEHPLPHLPPRDRDPRRPAGAPAVLRDGCRQASCGDGTGIWRAARQSSRDHGSRDHRQRAPIPRQRLGKPSRPHARGSRRRAVRQRHPRRGSQAPPGMPGSPSFPCRATHRRPSASPANASAPQIPAGHIMGEFTGGKRSA